MVADYMYWLSGGSEQHTSKLIKLYWQVKIDGPARREEPVLPVRSTQMKDWCLNDCRLRQFWDLSIRRPLYSRNVFIMK